MVRMVTPKRLGEDLRGDTGPAPSEVLGDREEPLGTLHLN